MREQKKVCYIKALKGKNQGEDGAKAGNIDSRMYGWIEKANRAQGRSKPRHVFRTQKNRRRKKHNKPGKCGVSGFRK